MFGLGIAIFYFLSEVEQFLHNYSIGSLCTINGVNIFFNALSALIGPLKVCLFRYFRGVFKNTYTQPKTEKLILHPPLGPWMPSNCLKALY